MLSTRLFFQKSHDLAQSRLSVDVGGHGDSGFRSMAAGIIDNYRALSLNRAHLSQVLQHHFVYYPQHRPHTMGLAMPDQLMDAVLNKMSMPEFISSLAYTLRQLAVDEMVNDPVRYASAFVQDYGQISPTDMRHMGTWIDACSMGALAKMLGIPVDVRVITKGKTLPSPPLRYPSEAKHATTHQLIIIELDRQHYQPCLLHSDAFQSNVNDSQCHTSPVQTPITDPGMPEILNIIAEAEKHLIAEFERMYIRLSTMVSAGELTQKHLLDMYIKSMSISDHPSMDRVHLSHLFSRAIGSLSSHFPSQMHDDAIVAELIYAIARAISIDQIPEAALFNHLEVTTQGNPSHDR